MLDTLLEAEANGGHIDNSGILEEVETFMFEGYDTTSTGIAFLLFVLAQYQDVQQNLYDEIVDEIDGNSVTIWQICFPYRTKLNFIKI